MKNLLLILSLGALMAGCSKDGPQDGETARVPVTLRVGEAPGFELSTRAPLEGWYNTSVWMAYGQSANAASTSFTGFTKALDGFVANNMTTFRPLLFYPADGTTIFLRGVYPRESITNLGANREITEDRILYTITGQEDIMVSNTLSGTEAVPIPDNAHLAYSHLLTRLSFTVRSTAVFPSTLRLTFIRVLNVSRNAVLDLDPTLNYDDAGILTFTDAPTSTLAAYGDEAGRQVTPALSEEFGNVMFRPGEAFDVEIGFNTGDVLTIPAIMTTGANPRDISDPSTGGTLRGMKYRVNVALSMQGFSPAISAAWVEQPTGIDRENWW